MMPAMHRRSALTLNVLLQGFAEELKVPELPVSGITSNSEQVKQGELFVAQAGLTRHAIDYAGDAVNAGAVAVIYDANDRYSLQRVALLSKQYDIYFIAINNLQQNTGEIASRFYNHPGQHFKLIGVTGTDGKTSVTHLLVQALVKLGKKAGSIGTLGYGVANELKMTQFTTPDAISLQKLLFELALEACEYVVMEVSSHALEQYRVNGCQFDIAVLTNLGSDHIDYHGDHANYRAAKSRLFDFQNLSARVINSNDEFGRALQLKYKGNRVVDYSSNTASAVSAQVKLLSSNMKPQGIQISVETVQGVLDINSGLIGDFNIDNLLACVAVLLQLGFDRQQIEVGMQGLQPIPGRMEYFPSQGQAPAVVIDFAHTEQALYACLNSLKKSCKGRLVCVFGCGGDRDQSKRPKMAAVAEQLADRVIVTDDNPRHESSEKIMRDILSGFKYPDRIRIIHDRQVAIETALAEAGQNDLVVIAGKGHEQIQIVGDRRLPFSDRYVVKQILLGAAK